MYHPSEFKYYDKSDYGFLDHHLWQLLNYLQQQNNLASYQFALELLDSALDTSLEKVEDIIAFRQMYASETKTDEEYTIVELISTILFFYLIDIKEAKPRTIKNTIGFLFTCSEEFKKLYLQNWYAPLTNLD